MDGSRVRRNEWRVLPPPPLGSWQPTRTVSVVMPAYQCQQLLELALAALTRQTYPAELFEVVVVDDGSEPKLELPPLAPQHCRMVRVSDHAIGWGRATALHVGATVADGEILHWLDADLVTHPEHVEAQARWHHLTRDAVTIGYKRFVPHGPWPPVEQVHDEPFEALFTAAQCEPHDYVEEFIEATGGLHEVDHLAFRAHVGATATVGRELYRAAGGLDTSLRLGEDSEFGYRLAQAGALFVPEPAARSWHLGPSSMMRDGDELRRYNRPFLAEAMPQPRWLRDRAPGRGWRVPLVVAAVPADGPLEQVRGCVDRLLAGDDHDLRVLLAADWSALDDQRRAVLDDPLLDRRLLAATYRSDPRVHLVDAVPESAFPSPYLLRVPSHVAVGTHTVRRMIEEADAHRVGLLRVVPRGAGAGPTPPVIELWRTAAVSRARRHLAAGESLTDAVDAMWGARWASGADLGVVDLSALPPADTDPAGVAETTTVARPVPVAGLRSLARATVYVARLAAARVTRRLRRP